MKILRKIDLFQKEINTLRPLEGEILEQIFELERQIGEELRELKGMLEESGEV